MVSDAHGTDAEEEEEEEEDANGHYNMLQHVITTDTDSQLKGWLPLVRALNGSLTARDHTTAFAFAFTLTSAHAHMSIGSQFGQSFLQLPPLPVQNCASTEFNQYVSITSVAMSDDFAAAAPRFIAAWAGHIHGTCARIHQHGYL